MVILRPDFFLRGPVLRYTLANPCFGELTGDDFRLVTLNVEDVEVAVLQRQVDPATTCAMAFGLGDTRFRDVMSDIYRS